MSVDSLSLKWAAIDIHRQRCFDSSKRSSSEPICRQSIDDLSTGLHPLAATRDLRLSRVAEAAAATTKLVT
ncbi:MAG: hypothetical protein KDB23_28030, partial [Planctomycetales bacterium]|nr:hypothetical protein [Planctomycetales bacterium]